MVRCNILLNVHGDVHHIINTLVHVRYLAEVLCIEGGSPVTCDISSFPP